MKRIFSLAVLAALFLAVLVVPATPTGGDALSRASHLTLADGKSPFPMCEPTHCTSGLLGTSAPILADGTGPVPLCWPPCRDQNSNLPQPIAFHRRGLPEGFEAI